MKCVLPPPRPVEDEPFDRADPVAPIPNLAREDFSRLLDVLPHPRNTGLYLLLHWIPHNSAALVRAEVLEGGRVHIEAFEPLSIDLPPTGVYDLRAVPGWVRARIAALSIMPIPPPPHAVDAVGLRVSETVFWIIQ